MRASGVPIRVEHEVIDDELACAFEQLRQSLLAAGSLEHVILVDTLPRQCAPLFAQLVAEPVEFLFFAQQFFPRFNPFCMRYDFVIRSHRVPSRVS